MRRGATAVLCRACQAPAPGPASRGAPGAPPPRSRPPARPSPLPRPAPPPPPPPPPLPSPLPTLGLHVPSPPCVAAPAGEPWLPAPGGPPLTDARCRRRRWSTAAWGRPASRSGPSRRRRERREERLRACRVFALRSLRGLLAASWFGLREIRAHRGVSLLCARVDNTSMAPPRG